MRTRSSSSLLPLALSAVAWLCPSMPAQTSAAGVEAGAAQQSPTASSQMRKSADDATPPLEGYLQEHPEVASQLKALLAQELSEQGSAIEEEALTDQVLASRLQSDAKFRADALRLMVDRGYLTKQQAQSYAPQAASQTGNRAFEALPSRQYPAAANRGQAYSVGPANSGIERERQVEERQSSESSVAEPAPLIPQTVPRTNPYPALPSTQDLYTQYSVERNPLKRFGADIFRPDAAGLSTFPADLPAGPDYVLGPGDTVVLDIWGGVSQHLTRVVDREGRISLPEAGPATVAGLSLAEAQRRIQILLAPQYHDVKVDVSVTRLRTIRVYVVGDVQRPGAYDISSLSTPLNALYVAGGPTAAGSLRTVKHFRGSRLISEQDLYELLIYGVRTAIEQLETGDTILVPPSGPQVGISGAVRRPAIYELKHSTDPLADMVEFAGGVTVSGSLDSIKVERFDPHDKRTTVELRLPHAADATALKTALNSFQVRDGDRVFVLSINPYKQQTIYLQGHVYRPGSYPYREGMTVKDLLQSYQDVLPEPSNHAEIVRLLPPDFRPQSIPFELHDVLAGGDSVALQQFDTVRIFGRYEIDPPKVAVYGDVLRPGEYPMGAGMTAAALVKMAGGFKRSAYLDSASLASYVVENGSRVVTDQRRLNVGAAVAGNEQEDIRLKPGDVLTILQIPGWSDIGRSVAIKGEVKYPGSYGINEGEKLSVFLKRVGGFREMAYPQAAILEREQVRKLEEEGREELIQRLQSTAATVRVSPNASGQDQAALLQSIQQQQTQAIARLQSAPVPGRLVINITSNIADWENTPNDITLRAGDVITIPKKPTFVLSYGAVYNANALTYQPGKTAGWYLKQSGGPTQLANKKGIYIVRANGSVISAGGTSDLFSGGVLNTKMQPGDVLVVPEKIVTGNTAWKTTLETTTFLATLALAAASIAHL